MKTIDQIKKIAVIGSGVMGSGIAQIAAMSGFDTILFDIEDTALHKAKDQIEKNIDGAIQRGKLDADQKKPVLHRIHYTDSFNDLKADIFIEAIVEKLDVKVKLFKQLADQNDEDSIFATNTSSIPITRIAKEIPQPQRVAGFHFFNPPHIMKLVEVIAGAATDETVVATLKTLAEKMGKKPVLAKDAPGFIVNRVARHFYVESLKLAEERIASFDVIDKQLESCGFKLGPFKLMDLIGVETNFSVTSSMFESFHYDSKFRPSRIQQQKVDAGHFGRKSGKGFYDYSLEQ